MMPEEDATRQKKPLKEETIPAKKEEENAQPNADETVADQDQPDWVGLPARDLKKNLGCG